MRLRTVDDALKMLVTVQTIDDRFAELRDYMDRFAAAVRNLPYDWSSPIVEEIRQEVDRWFAAMEAPPAGDKTTPTAAVRRWLYDNPAGGTTDQIHFATRSRFETAGSPREAVRSALKYLCAGKRPHARRDKGVYRGTAFLRSAMAAS